MASKSLFDFIEKTENVPIKTEQTTLSSKEEKIIEKISMVIKPITILGITYEVNIE